MGHTLALGLPNSRAAKEANPASSVTAPKQKENKKKQAKPTVTAGYLVRNTGHACLVKHLLEERKLSLASSPTLPRNPGSAFIPHNSPGAREDGGGTATLGTQQKKADQRPQKWDGMG